ncbi:hypothetical protein Q8F55_002471 [Vanrija albida]|uniref:Myb-like domain-containing protein n=1 Tax=Vanrija albida TaxID=181172 RepID=A0ABR3Q9W2_9TREE
MPADRTKPQPKPQAKAEPADPKRARTPWTPEEEVIFDEIAAGLLKKGMWAAVLADGRLKHRGANGIASHVVAKPRVHPTPSTTASSKSGSGQDEQVSAASLAANAQPKQRKKPEFWTSDEDRVLFELLVAMAKKQIWTAVQDDGRLAHKSNSAIHMRIKTLLGKGAPKP